MLRIVSAGQRERAVCPLDLPTADMVFGGLSYPGISYDTLTEAELLYLEEIGRLEEMGKWSAALPYSWRCGQEAVRMSVLSSS